MRRVPHLIAKVKWECDNDSSDMEQLREASHHWHFLDADTFLIQRPPSGSEVTVLLAENTFLSWVWRSRCYAEPAEVDFQYQIAHRWAHRLSVVFHPARQQHNGQRVWLPSSFLLCRKQQEASHRLTVAMKTCAHVEALILCGFASPWKKIKSKLTAIIKIIRVRQNSNTFRAIGEKKEEDEEEKKKPGAARSIIRLRICTKALKTNLKSCFSSLGLTRNF